MKKMFLIFSHSLTEKQKNQAKEKLGVNEFVMLPDDLQKLWSSIPPEIDCLNNYLKPIKQWLKKSAVAGDFSLIQGDFGAVYFMINVALKLTLIPIYSTTARKCIEKQNYDGTVEIKHIFKHIQFRKYQ